MEIQIRIIEVHDEQKGMDVNYSTPAYPEGRTMFVLFPVDASGNLLQGDALMDALANLAPVSELEQREALGAVASTAHLADLVGVAVTRSVQTPTEKKVAQILAEEGQAATIIDNAAITVSKV